MWESWSNEKQPFCTDEELKPFVIQYCDLQYHIPCGFKEFII